DFTAKLVDVHPDGSAFNISEGILRRSYQEAQGPSATEKVHEIHLELWPTSNVFFRGHRIRLEGSSSNFPRFDRNPNTGNRIAPETHSVTAEQTVRHGLPFPSRLILPIIPSNQGAPPQKAERYQPRGLKHLRKNAVLVERASVE